MLLNKRQQFIILHYFLVKRINNEHRIKFLFVGWWICRLQFYVNQQDYRFKGHEEKKIYEEIENLLTDFLDKSKSTNTIEKLEYSVGMLLHEIKF